MKYKYKISVIVPVYNIEKYIERCLKSIATQVLSEMEIIVVNDGSTDNSGRIINEIAKTDTRIIVLYKSNGGLSSARNAGIGIAQGEYLMHIDGDDWIEKGYLYDMYERAINDNLDVVVSDYWKDFDNGVIKKVVDLPMPDIQNIDGHAWLSKFFDREANQSMFNKLFRASLYKDNNIEHPIDVSLGEDLATTPRLMYYAERIGKINKCYYHYIQRSSSLTNGISKESTDRSLNNLMRSFEILNGFFCADKKILSKLENHRIAQIAIFIFTPQVEQSSKIMKSLIEEYLLANKGRSIMYTTKRVGIYSKLLRILPSITLLNTIQTINTLAAKVVHKLRCAWR